MSTKIVLAAAVLALTLGTGAAFAESEGNGDPFVLRTDGIGGDGRAFVVDTGSAMHPELTGRAVQPTMLALIEPVYGSEGPVHTAGSLPRGFGEGSLAYAQAANANRHFATHGYSRQVREASLAR